MTEHCDLNHAPIGVFDSGVGGLTVAREIMRQIPDERIVYFGDTARVPYGSKSPNTIIRYSRQIIRFLRTKNVKAIVVACNTASAFALETIKPELDIPIIGVVKPGAKVAARTTENGKIGVIGTEGTIRSEIYTKTIHRENKDAQVMGRACPLFVPLVEEGWIKDPVTVAVAERYLQPFKESDIDTLILGCTHYPLAKTFFRAALPGVKVVSQDELMAAKLENYLTRHPEIESLLTRGGTYRFEVSSLNHHAQKVAALLFPDIPVEKAANG